MSNVLVTITAPSASGKSYLLNHIRSAGYPCLVSTTTRAPRKGEVEGVDYYFISDEHSRRIEEYNGFAELAVYRGIRYGVTKTEFHNKLDTGFAFLIVEPTGIDHYVQPALDVGAMHLKYFIHCDLETRLERMKQRMISDLEYSPADNAKIVSTHLDRIKAMFTVEQSWFTMHEWTRVLSGTHSPADNLAIILADVAKAQVTGDEIAAFYSKDRPWL